MVYKAEDTKLDRFVALKFLPPHLSQAEEEKKRFIHEAKAASVLNHLKFARFTKLMRPRRCGCLSPWPVAKAKP